MLMLGLPKGSLEESTRSLFAKAGWKITVNSRSYRPSIDDPELDGRFVRAQEVSRYVEHGFFDCGLTGLDWIQENESDVVEVCDLIYSKASRRSRAGCLRARGLAGRSPAGPRRQAGRHRAGQTVKRYFAAKKIPVEVEFSWGATEVKVPDLVDAIVDITETGSRCARTSCGSSTRSWRPTRSSSPTRRAGRTRRSAGRSRRSRCCCAGALEAESKVGLKMNAPEEGARRRSSRRVPALRNPTISPLSNAGLGGAGDDHRRERRPGDHPQLKALGAEGIVEYPLNKVVY